ncbi:hypothetical protein HDU98_000975 [Podochytrium sp. JEL0797]|nr:hypothetical protein HDU98_000975 [Podochytrium sp. JEL0797]
MSHGPTSRWSTSRSDSRRSIQHNSSDLPSSRWSTPRSDSHRSLSQHNHSPDDLQLRDDLPREPPVILGSKRLHRFGGTFVHTTSQASLFSDNNMWEAVYEGDLEALKLYAMQDFSLPPSYHNMSDPTTPLKRGECERGGEGETILHIAVLRKHMTLVEWICDAFPDLVNEIYLKHRYFGETALHIAVVNSTVGDLTMVQFLVERGAKINGPLVTGTEFLKDDDKGCLYYGQTILQFAAVTQKDKILKYLVENNHDPADLTAVDIYGNNVLHVMAFYGDFELEVFQYIKARNAEDVKSGRSAVNLMHARNKDNLTPFQLGIACGHANIMEVIKELEWEFGSVRHYRVCIDDLDPIQPHAVTLDPKSTDPNTPKILNYSRVSKSTIEIAAERQDKAIITHPLIDAILKVKWALYVRPRFLLRFVLTLLLVICLTIAIALQPAALEDRRDYFSPSTTNSYPIVRLVFELLTCTGVLGMLAGEFQEFKAQGYSYFVGYGASENVIQWSFSALVFTIPVFRYAVAAAVDSSKWFYLEQTENIALGFAAILGWVYILYFTKGFKSVGPLIVVFQKILTEDLMQWLALYGALTGGFAAALFLQMVDAPAATVDENVPILDWNNYLGSVLWTVRFLFAQAIFDDFRHGKVAGFAEFLFIMYGFLVMVLLINVLIAKMVETYKEVAKDSARIWAVQFAFLILETDAKLPDSERHFLLQHIGWQATKPSPTQIVTPRYFLFTERDLPATSHSGPKQTETLKLIVAKDHEGRDIEIRSDADHWHGWTKELVIPFKKMRKEYDEARKKVNMWTRHELAVSRKPSVYSVVQTETRNRVMGVQGRVKEE